LSRRVVEHFRFTMYQGANNYFPRWSSSSWSIVNHRGAPLSIWNIVNRKAPDAEAPWNIVNQRVALAGWDIVSWGSEESR
jgi:hypothetical protein